jgi:hypothetical protein
MDSLKHYYESLLYKRLGSKKIDVKKVMRVCPRSSWQNLLFRSAFQKLGMTLGLAGNGEMKDVVLVE